MARARVRMDSAGSVYVRLLGKRSGADRDVKRRATAVANRAFLLAPKRSGRLARSISASQNRNERGRYTFGYNVTASASHAHYVHEGTGPSLRQSYPGMMKFDGTKQYTGQTIFTEIVRHPGTPAQPFLARALSAARR